MLDHNIQVDLANFKKTSLISSDEISEIYQIEEIKTTEKFEAHILPNYTDNFVQTFLYHLSKEINFITDQSQPLFVRFQGFSETDFNSEKHPVFILETTDKGKLTSIIQSENSKNSGTNMTATKILINIFGIAYAFLYLIIQKVTNLNLTIDDIYETSYFYPKINILTISKLKSIDKYQNDSSDFVLSYAMIVYSILTGKNPFKNDKQRSEFIEKVKSNSFTIEQPEFKIYEKIIYDCINTNKSSKSIFSKILKQLKNDQNFITNQINEKEYRDYIEYIEISFQIELDDEENEAKKYFPDSCKLIDPENFVVLGIISSNSNNKIYKIRDKKTGKLYSAKIFLKNEKFFLREIHILTSIKLQSIVDYYGVSYIQTKKTQQEIAIITDYMKNSSLADLLELLRKGYEVPYWTNTIKLINIYGIASAMKYLHSLNILHRDLSTNNILLDDFLFPKLADFGLSNYIDEIKQANMALSKGTKIFVAPEIEEDVFYSTGTDVYSFGIIIFEIMCSEKIKNYSIMHNYVNDFIANKSSKDHPELMPKAYEDLIKSCLNQNPDERPSFDEIIENIKNYPEFILDDVDIKLFQSYIEFIEKNGPNRPSFRKYSLEPIFEDYHKIMEMNDPLSSKIQTLNLNQFEKVKKIDEGGCGKVYLYRNKQTNQFYAAKKLKRISNSIEDINKRVKFSREVTILSQINHPCVIKYIGYSPTNIKNKPKPIIVTEFMPNNSLENLLRNERENKVIEKWTDTIKLINIFGIASAMKYLHSKNILHRDLKPLNVLLDSFLFPKLIDFGFSKFISNQNKSDDDLLQKSNSEIFGTYHFIAPEIYISSSYIKPSDVYSFGMLLYEIMNKEYPLKDLGRDQIVYAITINNYRPEIKSFVPIVFKNLIESCWDQDPNKRPTFDQIVDDLKTNPEYITEKVDKKLYQSYIEIVEQQIEIDDKSIIEKGFLKCSIKHEIRNYDDIYDMFSSLSSEGFVDISSYSISSKIYESEQMSFYDVVDQKTNSLLTATVSKNIETYNNFEKNKLSLEIKKNLKLNHPLIQKFYGFSFVDFKHQKKPVTITERISKNSLFDVLENERNGNHNDEWNITSKFILIYDIANAMLYLHSQKICHPNLNPKNILVDNEFHPKLSEIGFFIQPQNSRNVFSCSSSNFFDVSRLYLAPEILKTQQNMPKSDVYSFALIFYEILSNESPFKKINNYLKYLSKIMNENYRPSFDKTCINEGARLLIEKCWSENPSDRLSFSEIIYELEHNKQILQNDIDKSKYVNYIKYFKEQSI